MAMGNTMMNMLTDIMTPEQSAITGILRRARGPPRPGLRRHASSEVEATVPELVQGPEENDIVEEGG